MLIVGGGGVLIVRVCFFLFTFDDIVGDSLRVVVGEYTVSRWFSLVHLNKL